MDLNLPFLPQDPSEIPIDDLLVSGGCIVAAAYLPLDDGTRLPAILFRFHAADGSGFHPGIIYACDSPAELAALPGLIQSAVDRALGVL